MNANTNRATLRILAPLFLLAAPVVASMPTGRTASAAPADTISLTSPSSVTIPESDDYATQVLADPWDMNSLDDVDSPYQFGAPQVANGIWTGTTSGPNGSIMFQYQNFSTMDSYLGEKDGVNYPIDTSRFTHLRVRMNVSQGGQTLLWWFLAHQTNGAAGNSNFIQVQPGWHIYDLDLTASGGGGSGNWSALHLVSGLRFDAPWNIANNTVQFDWARLTPANSSQPLNIAWTYNSNSNPNVTLYLSTVASATQDNEYSIATVPASDRSFTWGGAGAMGPGTYYIHAEMNGAWSSSGPFTVNAAPLVRIDAPGPLSGEDFAQASMAQNWQGDNPTQFQRVGNLTHFTWSPDYMQAAPTNGDPQVFWTFTDSSHPIDTSRYRYMNIHLWVQTPIGRPDTPFNAGPRITWAEHIPLDYQQTFAILAPYNRWLPVTFDLPNTPLDLGGYGWTGQVTTFRFDPFEPDDSYGRQQMLPDFFRIDKAHLTSQPISGAGTLVRWTHLQGSRSGQVDLYWDSNNSGFDGTRIASNLPADGGSYVWDTSGMANGTYWVYAVAHDGYNSGHWYSLAPLVVNHSSASTIFSDVPTNYWAANDINNIALRGIVGGYGEADTTLQFHPGATATRAQLSKMVVLAAGWPLITPPSPTFADVPASAPLYSYVETAAQHGVTSGYQCGGANEPCDPQRRPYFRPNNNVTRGQTAKMISVSRGWRLIDPGSATFADVAAGSPLYPFVETASTNGIITGYQCGGVAEPCDAQHRPYFRPGNSVTRAQLSAMLGRAIGLENK